jgi:hypothetical protein
MAAALELGPIVYRRGRLFQQYLQSIFLLESFEFLSANVGSPA